MGVVCLFASGGLERSTPVVEPVWVCLRGRIVSWDFCFSFFFDFGGGVFFL